MKPINSLYTAKTQKTSLIDTMFNLLMNINMPGYLLIKPKKIDQTSVYKYYVDAFKKNGKKEFMGLAQSIIKDIKKYNDNKDRYRYDIYLCFCDGRSELKKRSILSGVIGNKETNFSKKMISIFSACEQQIWKKLSTFGLSTSRLSDPEQIQRLMQYLAIPLEQEIEDYYTGDDPEKVPYHYVRPGDSSTKNLYTKTFVASKFDFLRIHKDDQIDDVINCLQLESFPTDVIVKFDLEHTREFKRNMTSKKVRVGKELKTYYSLSDNVDEEGKKAKALAEIGEKRDESIEKSKIRWQLFFRIRSTNEKSLDKFGGQLRRLMSDSGITLSNEFGSQDRLAKDLFPWKSDFVKYVQLTDIKYFTRYNWLGGLFIGEEAEGFIESYTRPGDIPIFTDISNTLTASGAARNSSVTLYSGETGSGKTQQADLRAFIYMIFRGMRVLCIDPKGDRDKKAMLLGNSAAHLKIGSKECQDGMFDAYLMYKDPLECLSQAKRDIDSLSRALDIGHQISYSAIEKAHYEMLTDYQENRLKKMTFTIMISEYLIKQDEILSKELLTLRNDEMGRLFFANDETIYDDAFNLVKSYNLVTFEKIPPAGGRPGEFDPNRLERAVFAVVLSRVQIIINGFMKRFAGEETILEFDEYKVYKSIDGGEAIVENTVRQVRSWLTHLLLITQSPSDVSDGILNNVGQYFVGSLASVNEIEFILNHLKLQNNPTIKKALMDRTTDEGVEEDLKYRFLYVDYNGRKCITRNQIPTCLFDSFQTLKKKSDDSKNSYKNNQEQDKLEIESFLSAKA